MATNSVTNGMKINVSMLIVICFKKFWLARKVIPCSIRQKFSKFKEEPSNGRVPGRAFYSSITFDETFNILTL